MFKTNKRLQKSLMIAAVVGVLLGIPYAQGITVRAEDLFSPIETNSSKPEQSSSQPNQSSNQTETQTETQSSTEKVDLGTTENSEKTTESTVQDDVVADKKDNLQPNMTTGGTNLNIQLIVLAGLIIQIVFMCNYKMMSTMLRKTETHYHKF